MGEKKLTQDESRKLVHAFLEVNHLHRQVCENATGTLGVHRSQHMMLMYLSHVDVPQSQNKLAREFGISPAAVTVSLNRLENAGYILREASAEDGRINRIHITDKGRRVVEDSRKIFSGIDDDMLAGFSSEETAAMKSYLERMAENLKKAESGSRKKSARRKPEEEQSK